MHLLKAGGVKEVSIMAKLMYASCNGCWLSSASGLPMFRRRLGFSCLLLHLRFVQSISFAEHQNKLVRKQMMVLSSLKPVQSQTRGSAPSLARGSGLRPNME